jgi:hypothetical protein
MWDSLSNFRRSSSSALSGACRSVTHHEVAERVDQVDPTRLRDRYAVVDGEVSQQRCAPGAIQRRDDEIGLCSRAR